MADTVQEHDFIELDYTGKLTDGIVFDTTKEKIAKENDLPAEGREFKPAVICVGEKQILPGLDDKLIGKEIGKELTIELNAEEAFGKRDIKKMRIVPASTFKEHKVQPRPGLQIDVDGEMGIISRVSGGRIIVNFNHPLAGKEVTYTVKVNRKITDKAEQISAFLNTSMRLPMEQVKIEIKEEKATVNIPFELPPPVTDVLGKKLAELTGLKEVKFSKKEEGKQASTAPQ